MRSSLFRVVGLSILSTLSVAALDNIYIFGDSLSDTGNTHLSTNEGSLDGRFSNGRLWHEWLADRLKVPTAIASKKYEDGLPHATNFSCSSATPTPSITDLIPGVSDVQQQIIGEKKLLSHDLDTSNAFDREGRHFNNQDMVFVWAGANNLFFTDMTGTEVAAEGMGSVLDLLAQRDVKKLVIMNLPDIGSTPCYSDSDPAQRQNATEFSRSFNAELDNQLDNFQKKYASIQIVRIDVYTLFEKLLGAHKEAGFTYGNDAYWCSDTTRNPDDFIFFDDVHPTEAGHRYISERLFEQLVIVPSEHTWNALINTMWSASANLEELISVTDSRMMNRHETPHAKKSFWVSGLGSYLSQSSDGQAPGFGYRSWGYCLGVDSILPYDILCGIAAGMTYGTLDMDEYLGRVDQDASQWSIYAQKTLYSSDSDSINLKLNAGWSVSRQNSNTRSGSFLEEIHQGKWNDNSWLSAANVYWTHNLSENLVLETFTGFQYVEVNQNNTTITGTYENYRIKDGSLAYLRMPVGTGIIYHIPLSGEQRLTLKTSVAVSQHLYRDNPTALVEVAEMSWEARGCNPNRTSLIYTAEALYRITSAWAMSLGYVIDASDSTQYQSGRASLTYSF